MSLWRFIPPVGRPFNPAYRDTWAVMTRRERQWSCLADVCVCIAAICFFAWIAS